MSMPRPCMECGAPTTTGSRCPRHRIQRAGGNGWSDAKARERILNRDMHMCRKCGRRATEVDHVVPLHMKGADADYNKQSLCKECHDRKTNPVRANGNGRRRRGR